MFKSPWTEHSAQSCQHRCRIPTGSMLALPVLSLTIFHQSDLVYVLIQEFVRGPVPGQASLPVPISNGTFADFGFEQSACARVRPIHQPPIQLHFGRRLKSHSSVYASRTHLVTACRIVSFPAVLSSFKLTSTACSFHRVSRCYASRRHSFQVSPGTSPRTFYLQNRVVRAAIRRHRHRQVRAPVASSPPFDLTRS